MALFIRDLINPLGPQYGASARGAESAAATQQSMDDMLLLAMAADESERRELARQIFGRRQVIANRAARGRWVRNAILLLIVAFFAVVWQLGDPKSSLSAAARAFVEAPLPKAPDRTNAPTRAVRAPAAQQDYVDPAIANGDAAIRAVTTAAAQDGQDVGVWCSRRPDNALCEAVAD